MLEEVERIDDLLTDLIGRAEDVSIILLEASNSDETAESTGDFISMKHTEISVTEGKITITVDTMLKHHAMSGAIH